MPPVHTTEQWFLKRSAAVYGPVTRQELIDWATSGRIRPDDLVSSDNITWHSPAEIPFLQMCWMIEPPGGQPVGPVNLAALIDPLLKGTLSPQATVRHLETGQSEPLYAAVVRHLLLQRSGPEPAVTENLKEELSQARQELERLRNQVRELQQQAASAGSMSAAPRGKEQPDKAATPSPRELDDNLQRLDSVIQTELAELRQSLQKREETILALEREISELRGEAHREREEANRLRERLHELAAAHEGLLRSFRELHARIVSRTDVSPAAAPSPETAQPQEQAPTASGPQKKPRRLRLI